jgi:E3 ubiquitin-protein ligase SHPRH
MLPEEDKSAEDSDERPSKRPRSSTAPSSVTILRHEFAFTTKSPTLPHDSGHIRRKDVGRYLRLQKLGDDLNVKARVKSKTANFETFFPLNPADLSDSDALTALDTMRIQSCDPEIEGSIWAGVDIDISLDGHQVDIGLTVEVNWSESQSVYWPSKLHSLEKALREKVRAICLPTLDPSSMNTPSPPTLQTFYDAVCVPETDLPATQIPRLSARLYPFQRKSVQWLLNREGVQWCRRTESNDIVLDSYDPDPSTTPISFLPAKDAEGKPFSISPLFDVVTRDPSPSLQFQHIKGGILAEEMGLGKTLEIISLILLHPRPEEGPEVFDRYLGRQLRVGKGTLIVTPPSLLDQWLSEIRRHAPELAVMHYPGLPPMASGKRNEKAIVGELSRHDVVVTTYDVLRAEIHAAMDPPARSMRGEQRYERARSPLVEISWWRVCIDEAQMVESRQSNVAVMARLIPRINAWAITGTPVKDSLQDDLRGLLAFLRYEPYASNNDVWKRLFSQEQKYFEEVFHLICLRHTKSQVRSEIELPPQKRYVITMPFSAVEEQNYNNMFEMFARTCGLDAVGNPLGNNWDPADPAIQQAMRVALDQLRQAVLQPGPANGRRLGGKEGPLRTLADVLDAMLDQSESKVRTLQRSLLSLQLTRGQVLATLSKTHDALAIWQQVLEKNATVVEDCRKQLQQEIDVARQSAEEDADSSDDAADTIDDEDLVSPRVSEARRRLRHALDIQHKAAFFCANAYFSIKSDQDQTPPDSEEFQRLEKLETEGYDSAKAIRKEILQESQGKAKKLMDKLAENASTQDFAVIPELKSMDQKGIESRRIVDAFEHLSAILDEQANVLDEWREHVIQLLLKSLVDEETDEITGEEYEQSTKLSEEILVYVQALKTVLADRYHVLSGQPNFLIEHEYKGAVRLATAGEGPCPEKLLELFKVRDELKPDFEEGDELSSLRGIIAALRNLSTKLQQGAASGSNRSATELAIVTHHLKLVQKQLTDQSKAITSMEREADFFTNTMNARIEFYRQLQAVSDMVADYEGDKSEEGLQSILKQEDNARNSLSVAQGRHRYCKSDRMHSALVRGY